MNIDNRTNEPTRAQVEAAARISAEVLNEYRKIAAWLEGRSVLLGPVGDTMHGLAAEALTNLIEHEYSRHTIPPYGMLDLWMALYGTSHPQFDEFYEKHGYAETWARLLAEVRSRAAAGAAPQAESDEQVHFAPYMSATAACGEAVPKGALAVKEGDRLYADTRFTDRRKETTCAECVSRAQIVEHGTVQPSSTVDVAALAEVIANAGVDYNLSDRSAESHACGAPDYRSVFIARAVVEAIGGEGRGE